MAEQACVLNDAIEIEQLLRLVARRHIPPVRAIPGCGRFEERIADSDQIGIAELARSNLIRDGIFGGEAAFGERVNHASIALADGDDASRGRMRDATAANRGWRPDRVA